eukprot:6445421-Pyramimonas_sp.AAC.1
MQVGNNCLQDASEPPLVKPHQLSEWHQTRNPGTVAGCAEPREQAMESTVSYTHLRAHETGAYL